MPQRLGRYVVRRRIGSGGFATVWLAYDEQLDSPVAVKVLADNWTEDAHIRRRFAEEGRYLRKVESPHVVSVYDAGELDDGRPYLVMSYADQGTLADRLEIEGVTSTQAMEVVRQVGAGLQALHDRDILHRDVKPANVLFRSVPGAGGRTEVRAMLGDLGLGKALDMSSRLTMVAGTPSYVAPEQALAEDLDARADQYSLAALAYLLLAGRPPFSHANLRAAADPPQMPPMATPGHPVSRAVEDVVRRGLARDREDRFARVSDFVAALEAALVQRLADEDSTTSLAGPWMTVDPDLTQPGPRPSPAPTALVAPSDTGPGSVEGSRRRLVRRAGVLVGALVLLAVGVGSGYAAARSAGSETVVRDTDGGLAATVPTTWGSAVGDAGWEPPGSDGTRYAAFSAGTSTTWTSSSRGQGIFAGLLPGTRLPTTLPQHPECGSAEDEVRSRTSQGDAVTVVHRGCPGGIIVERVVQVTENRLLWVQIRSRSGSVANTVLDSVVTSGLR